MEKLDAKQPFGRPRKWDGSVDMNLTEVNWGMESGLNWLRVLSSGGFCC
jgi:hypothetical protein